MRLDLLLPSVSVCVCFGMMDVGHGKGTHCLPPHTPQTLWTISTHYSGVSVSLHNWVASETSHDPCARVHVYHVPSAPPLHSTPNVKTSSCTWTNPTHFPRHTHSSQPQPFALKVQAPPEPLRKWLSYSETQRSLCLDWAGLEIKLQSNKNKAIPLNIKPK